MAKDTGVVQTLTPKLMEIALTHTALHTANLERQHGSRAPFVWGPPGIGKSQIIRQIAERNGFNFVDIRLSQMDPTDLRGIPYPGRTDDGQNVLLWSKPYFLNHNHKTMYFFDEMNAAAQSIQAASYQIILDRKIGEYQLRPDDVVIAAGNRQDDKGSTYKMPTPLMNRFIHLEMEPKFDDWQEWALVAGVHPVVVAYLTWQSHKLFEFDPKSVERGFPTPRSWEFVSDLLQDGSERELPRDVLRALIAGCVGNGATAPFMEFLKLRTQLPNPRDILRGKVEKINISSKDIGLMYALIIGLCYQLRELEVDSKERGLMKPEDFIQCSDTFFKFIMNNGLQPEMIILGARTVLNTLKIGLKPKLMPNYKKFAEEHRGFILDGA